MSLFRRPKKPMQRRVFGANSDDDIDGNNGDVGLAKGDDDSMDVDAAPSFKERRSEKKPLRDVDKPKKNSLLSFDDDGMNDSCSYTVCLSVCLCVSI